MHSRNCGLFHLNHTRLLESKCDASWCSKPAAARRLGFAQSISGVDLRNRKCRRKIRSKVKSGISSEARPAFHDEYPPPVSTSLELDVGEKKLRIDVGEVGRQANGAILATDGETVLYATVCCDKAPKSDGDFVPLSVQYQEKFSAAGKTAQGFLKRERQRDHEILTSRLVDRAIRPLFATGWVQETQLLEWVMSYDGVNSPEPLAITAAGAALAVSDIPLTKAVAGVRVGWIDGRPVLNPTVDEMEGSKLDLMLAGTTDAVIMIEGYSEFLPEEDMLEALKVGSVAVNSMASQISEWASKVGKEKILDTLVLPPEGLLEKLEGICGPEMAQIFKISQKATRNEKMSVLWTKVAEEYVAEGDPEGDGEEGRYKEVFVKMAFKKLQSKTVRRRILEEGIRIDGRTVQDIRPITSRAQFLPRTHGSALFTRGSTQALCVTTLGNVKSAQRIDTLQEDDLRKFYLQYFFPPSSVGETGRVLAMGGRRELGHGELASKSLASIVPAEEDFPYTIRVESTITESDGSSSMASVCGGCLSMMDAGVPVVRPVAGIAMGLILDEDSGQFEVLSDILGTEDALGDMDFKVAGDENSITGFQMDMKIEGITLDIITEALQRAKEGRKTILGEMAKCSPGPRKNLSEFAPKIFRMQIDPKMVAKLIGSGGKTIRGLQEAGGVEALDVNDEGVVEIVGANEENVATTAGMVEIITKDPAVGAIFKERKVVNTSSFGAFVELAPGRDGLIHVSELAVDNVANVEDVVKEGDRIDVQVLGVNDNGKVALSRRTLLTGVLEPRNPPRANAVQRRKSGQEAKKEEEEQKPVPMTGPPERKTARPPERKTAKASEEKTAKKPEKAAASSPRSRKE